MLPPIKKTYDRVESFFLKSDLWIFATVFTAICLILTLESEPASLPNFLARMISYSVIFLPTFWFVQLRARLKSQMSKWSFRGLWIFIFGIYPWFLALLAEIFMEGIPEFIGSANDAIIGALAIGTSLLGTATVLHGVIENSWLPNLRKRIGRYLSPTVIIGIFSVLAAMISVAETEHYDRSIRYVNEFVAVGIFFVAVLQVLLVYLPYLALFQIHHKFLYRKLFQQRGLLYYIVGGVTATLAFAPVHAAYARLFPLVRSWGIHTSGFEGGIIAPENFAMAAGFLIFSIPVVLLLEWVRKTRTITLLEKEKTDTELSLLKQQVNPHFFFNTLNNLYSLSLKQAPETPDTVLQLSELMRYVIYRAKEERVELREEVKYLKDYLDLQRIRLYQDADIEFAVDMENPDLKIPPLLFIILVENAFKHGIEPAVGECFLELKLTEINGDISFYCRNSVEPEASQKVRSGGIGLENLHRRLDLLYPDGYDISTDTRPDEYAVRLNLRGDGLPPHEELRLEELVPNLDEQLL
ncbi:sensor histidine kinase [Neolewinella aurantiaca]|nr:histidine kinase [Neolewinella aurantiaca]